MQKLQLFQKPMLLLSFLLVSVFCFSQVTQQWVRQYNSAPFVEPLLAVDASGNVYIAGGSNEAEIGDDFSISDCVTIKYDAAGNVLWERKYDGPDGGDDYATDLDVDGPGNVYVTAVSYGGETGNDYATIKYDAAGAELWVRRHNGVGNSNDEAHSLAVDASGNVYVTGNTATIKYDAAGNELWVKTNIVSSSNSASSLVVDASGNVYVIGYDYSSETGYGYDYATQKFDTQGNKLWARIYNSFGNGQDYASSLAVDASGNVYVTGRSHDDYATVKYNGAGNELWVKRYNGLENGQDYAASLAVDALGNVYVTGQSEGNGTNDDFATIKYDAAGNELWVKRYNEHGSSIDQARSLTVDAAGNVYVTGKSGDAYATIKYNAAGTEQWATTYKSGTNGEYSYYSDEAISVVVDASGKVYVTGEGSVTDDIGRSRYYYTTIKYTQTQMLAVYSFTLINADSDKAIRILQDGDTLNLATLATLNLNIRANTTPATIGSVVFKLSGVESRNHTENIVPYALFADNNKGDYYTWTPTNGSYTLTATPYSGSKGSGTAGTPLTIHFTVTGAAVSSLILVNAQTDTDIKTLKNGDVIDLANLPTRNLNIRAAVHPDTVGSVVFNLNNKLIVRENVAPYAIGGDIKGDYRAWTLPTGNHTLTATPYALANGKGTKGKGHSVTFTVVDMTATVQAKAVNLQQKAIAETAQDVEQRLIATPNPFAGQTTIRFSVSASSRTLLEVYDAKGVMVERLYDAQAQAGKGYNVPFNSKQLAAGLYMAKLTSGKQVQSYKLVLIR